MVSLKAFSDFRDMNSSDVKKLDAWYFCKIKHPYLKSGFQVSKLCETPLVMLKSQYILLALKNKISKLKYLRR